MLFTTVEDSNEEIKFAVDAIEFFNKNKSSSIYYNKPLATDTMVAIRGAEVSECTTKDIIVIVIDANSDPVVFMNEIGEKK